MSVGHSRRTSRSPSPSAPGRGGELRLEVALDAVLLERRRLAHLVRRRRESTSCEPDLEPVLGLARALAHDDRQRVALLLDHRRRRHPVERLVAAGVGVHEHRPVGLEHEQARRLRQEGGQPAGVDDLAAGDDEAHGPHRTVPFGQAAQAAPMRFVPFGSKRESQLTPEEDLLTTNARTEISISQLQSELAGEVIGPDDVGLRRGPQGLHAGGIDIAGRRSSSGLRTRPTSRTSSRSRARAGSSLPSAAAATASPATARPRAGSSSTSRR